MEYALGVSPGLHPAVKTALEELSNDIAKSVGITLIGNRLTLRTTIMEGKKRKDLELSAVILSVDDGSVCDYCKQSHEWDFCRKMEDDTIPQ